MRSPLPRVPAAGSLCCVAALALGVGCSSTAYEREQQRLTSLQQSLAAAAERLNAADLPGAEAHLDEAGGLAESDYERRKVASLRGVVEGADRLAEGDGPGAAAAWSRIQSPTLRYEVQEKAAGVGIQVPDRPVPAAE
ncbi:hypothetical protein [Phycisphaera mikurensis]|uniref:Lipoprotein n=1 Tax=Phycisphaera mikurensis (strain NBRC 102666 / KCTC 22515 / FYK2301M01) TaxID=1142394 RepID=I0IEJ7_PHYMF|nr:hypothetical protein [Phycisphaera mikurensis]MBB6441484.1 hypothetical protein [Phycisphaera mikurensis]BAM03685.1 hypothetical protein PSMK_15260 [Phycisphaera mikurensis NBRC 102666]